MIYALYFHTYTTKSTESKLNSTSKKARAINSNKNNISIVRADNRSRLLQNGAHV